MPDNKDVIVVGRGSDLLRFTMENQTYGIPPLCNVDLLDRNIIQPITPSLSDSHSQLLSKLMKQLVESTSSRT